MKHPDRAPTSGNVEGAIRREASPNLPRFEPHARLCACGKIHIPRDQRHTKCDECFTKHPPPFDFRRGRR